MQWFQSLAGLFRKEPSSKGSSLFNVRSKGSAQNMWMFVGLGNPGDKYKLNRHNVGFMVIDAICDDMPSISPFKKKFQGQVAEARLGTDKVLLLKPETYMNNSGQSVAKAAKFYKIPPEKIIVFHDELDIEPKDIRVKCGGGNAGHNGLKSIQVHLGTADFWRIRIGIGRPEHKGQVSNYVLNDFSKNEQVWLTPLLSEMVSKVELVLGGKPEAYGEELKRFSTNILSQ